MRLSSLALALAATFALNGCVDSDEDTVIIILQNQAPNIEDNCAPSVDPTDPFIPRGLVDANSPGGYVLSPIVQNLAVSVENVNKVFLMQGADITLEPQPGFFDEGSLADLRARNLLQFSQPFSGVVDDDGGITFIPFEIIPVQLLAEIQARLAPSDILQLRSQVQIFGQMHGGELKSQKFDYWVDVCNGCMVPEDLGACANLPTGFTASPGSCWAPRLQDFVTQCCTDEEGATVCGGTF